MSLPDTSAMMQIHASQLGKKYQREWIFRNLSLLLEEGNAYALLGSNGSGKTTLMLILSGLLPPSKGDVIYKQGGRALAAETFYQYQAIVAPYQEVIEEFTLEELLKFHFSLKQPIPGMDTEGIMEAMYLEQARHKYIRQFSSGMRQRLKLGLAFYSQNRVLFLDEPCSNLDARGIEWYQQEVRKILSDRIVLVCSNQPYEYEFVQKKIYIEHYK